MTRLFCILILVLWVGPIQAADVLAAGNSLGPGDQNFNANIAQVNHTFTFVTTEAFPSTDLTGFEVVWLDGFSSFSAIPVAALTQFVESGGRLIVQSPGFGGNPMADYPLGTDLVGVFDPDANFPVNVVAAAHPFNAGLTSETLTGWNLSAVGYFFQHGDFTPITTTQDPSQAVTLVRSVGLGEIVYTQQPLSSVLQQTVYASNAPQLRLLNNFLSELQRTVATPPGFLKASDFSIGPEGHLLGLLPNPNSDGLDVDGSAHLGYEYQLMVNGVATAGPRPVSAESWPHLLIIPPEEVPAEPYYVAIARTADGSPDSQPVLLIGPQGQATNPGVLGGYRRWLLHIPRKAGGFSAVIRLENPNPSHSADVHLIAYASNGTELAVDVINVSPLARLDRNLYDTVFGDPALLDQISHMAVWDVAGNTKASLRYVADNSGFGVWVSEVNLSRDPVTGSEFLIDGATPSTAYYDGVAVLNLSSAITSEIRVTRYNADGAASGVLSLGQLLPGSKMLSALSFAFPDTIPNASYRVEAIGQAASSIQLLGISGATSGTFFATANITRVE